MSVPYSASLYNMIAINVSKKGQKEEKATPEMIVLLPKPLRSSNEVVSAEIPEKLLVSNNKLLTAADICLSLVFRKNIQGRRFQNTMR